jgi:hypothetical protein
MGKEWHNWNAEFMLCSVLDSACIPYPLANVRKLLLQPFAKKLHSMLFAVSRQGIFTMKFTRRLSIARALAKGYWIDAVALPECIGLATCAMIPSGLHL